jgi:hypothetical protein
MAFLQDAEIYINLKGWDVKVVLPNAQKSWIGRFISPKHRCASKPIRLFTPHHYFSRTGKAYHIKELTKGYYFYPKEDGSGEIAVRSRPLQDGELVRTRHLKAYSSPIKPLYRLNGYSWMEYEYTSFLRTTT